ncbi:hypothetical protein F4703DRAFT_1792351 [Phycomyces blakesleeanus]
MGCRDEYFAGSYRIAGFIALTRFLMAMERWISIAEYINMPNHFTDVPYLLMFMIFSASVDRVPQCLTEDTMISTFGLGSIDPGAVSQLNSDSLVTFCLEFRNIHSESFEICLNNRHGQEFLATHNSWIAPCTSILFDVRKLKLNTSKISFSQSSKKWIKVVELSMDMIYKYIFMLVPSKWYFLTVIRLFVSETNGVEMKFPC